MGKRAEGDRLTRQCALTRDIRPVDDLIRFALAPDGSVAPDLKAVLPGRGVWITGHRAAVDRAVAKGIFARGFKQPAIAPPDLGDRIDALLVRDLTGALAMAIKAGRAVRGFGKVSDALQRGEVAILFHACDGAPDGYRKLHGRIGGDPPHLCRELRSDELGLAFGRPAVIHAAGLNGPTAGSLRKRADRLAAYRASDCAGDTA